MKNLRNDDSALLGIIAAIGVGIATLFGFSYFAPSSWIELAKVIVIASLLFVFGIIALTGKFALIPKPFGLIAGIASICAAIYLVYRGGF